MSSSSARSLNDIRETFLQSFAKAGHTVVPSAPLVPKDDPTLLFVNAGMVPFKNLFTGAEVRDYSRAVSSQKCVRAGGKHNDLDNVGYTARHHTFFEMLGNFSFGDYFKDVAIEQAWDLITKTFGLSKDRLLVTVYADDDEAHGLWRKISGLSDDRIIRIGTLDNFWSMGDTGPCGPCSEIFFDHGDHIPGGPPGSPDEDGDRFVEIWNLVFMQYEQKADGSRVDLPKPSIDTGMGLERIAAVLQGVHDNYDTDLFKTLISASEELTKTQATGAQKASHRVIADHLRSSAFLVADGVTPSNEGRGYVLRRIMRRAMRHAHLLGAKAPLMHQLVASLVQEMGEAYAELGRAEALITETLRAEEERFRETLGRGMSLLDEASAQLKAGDKLPGDVAFKLYDTYGFPLDLTEDVLRARDITVDHPGFDAAMAEQKARARANWVGSGDQVADDVWFGVRDRLGRGSTFLGYEQTEAQATIVALLKDGQEVENLEAGETGHLVTDETPFYAEGGGQTGDAGHIRASNGLELEVTDTQSYAGDLVVHSVKVKAGQARVGDRVDMAIDAPARVRIRANHSAAHLFHAAVRRVVGDHVTQKGQMVDAERMRFDFSHNQGLTPAQIEAIEDEVNAVILQNMPATTQTMSPDDAIAAGALALFGEKYDDDVRVLSLGHDPEAPQTAYSMELCGGTHVARTGDIGLFKIVSESAVASGIRRVEALTGQAARAWMQQQINWAQQAAAQLKTPLSDLPARVQTLQEDRKALEKQLTEAKKKLALGGGGAQSTKDIAGLKVQAAIIEDVPAKDLRDLIEQGKAKADVVAYISKVDGKAAVAVGISKDKSDQLSAVDLVRTIVVAMGGKGGGGRPELAQGGVPSDDHAEAGLAALKDALAKQTA